MTEHLRFFAFLGLTLGITWWAARRTRTTEHFYAAGRSITATQNGFALAGDYMSASSFLGISGLVALSGFDGLIYAIGGLAGWPVVLFLIAEPLRNLGRFTFADVVAFRMRQVPVRIAAALGTLSTITFYLIAQMVGAGALIRLLFDLPYEVAVGIVGAAMIAYVLFGGMLATRIVKAVRLLAGAVMVALLVLAQVGFSPLTLFARAAEADGVAILVFIIGFGAMVLVGPEAIRAADPGGNMAAPLLASKLGGPLLLGFIGAVALATILAVVAGLTLSGAAALSHDLWVHVFRRGVADPTEELRVARVATLLLGGLAVGLGIAFKGQNVAFMVGLAFAIAASGNFPALLLTMFWRGCTSGGVVAAMITGTTGTLLLIYLSPTVQVDILHHPDAAFPLRNPAIVTLPLALATAAVTSRLTRNSAESAAFAAMERKALLGD